MANPTKYKKEYCADLVEHMAQGYSFHSFGGKIKVGARTLFDWLDRHPEFQDAKDHGEVASLYFWEKTGIAGTHGKIKGFQQASWIFNMKARFAKQGWRDIPEDPDKITNKDRSELAKQLLNQLTVVIGDKSCSNSVSPLSPPLSSSGLLGASKKQD